MRHLEALVPTTVRARSLLAGAVLAGLLALAPAVAGAGTIITGAGAGGGPHVKVFDAQADVLSSFDAYDSGFTGGVRVATGDVNGDGVADIITGAGAGGGPHVQVFDGVTGQLIESFDAFDANFTGGVYVAAGDVNGDGYADIITGAGAGGGPHVQVFSGKTGAVLQSFDAFDSGFTGGVRVAAADVNGDGFADIIVGAGAGGGPHVKVFDGRTGQTIRSFFAYDPLFTGGVYVAAADVNGDGRADIVTGADSGAAPQVSVFDGVTSKPLLSFDAFDAAFTGGVRVATGDVNGDGKADIITAAGAGGGPHVHVFSTVASTTGAAPVPFLSFDAFDSSFTGGVYVAGGPKGATDQVPDLHGLVTSLALGSSLNAFFQNKVSDVQSTLGKYVSPCSSLDQVVLGSIDKAGKPKGMLPYAGAERLSAATYPILIGLSCIPSTSPQPVVVNELIGLLDTVDSARVSGGVTSVLIGLLRKAGDAAVTGSACKPLAAVTAYGKSLAPRASTQPTGPLNILIGLLLPAVQKISDDDQCRAVGA